MIMFSRFLIKTDKHLLIFLSCLTFFMIAFEIWKILFAANTAYVPQECQD